MVGARDGHDGLAVLKVVRRRVRGRVRGRVGVGLRVSRRGSVDVEVTGWVRAKGLHKTAVRVRVRARAL